jgi:pyruvate-formate lyase
MSQTRSAARTERAARCAADFEFLLEVTPVYLPPAGRLAGPVSLAFEAAAARLGRHPDRGDDNLHFPMNVAALMRQGFAGIARTAARNAERQEGEPAVYLRAMARCHAAAARFAAAHADAARARAAAAGGADRARLASIAAACSVLGERAPQRFAEAVQLFWFAWCLRGRGTIGRLDQHLYPFYAGDLEAGRLTREDAFALLRELWEGLNRAGRGDTLANLMLGGQDREGRDATNALSLLMLDVSVAVRDTEPHLSARVHRHTPPAFLDRLLDLQLLGHGQGTVYNDEVLVPALAEAGVPLASARNYANDGCTEVVIDGESGIELAMTEDVKVLELALFNGEENRRRESRAGTTGPTTSRRARCGRV